MRRYAKSNDELTNNNRIPIIVIGFSARIFSIVILLLLSSACSYLFSFQQPHDKPFYAFAQTQELNNPALSLSNLIKQGRPIKEALQLQLL